MQRGTNEPVAVWCAPDVDIVKAGLYVIVKVFSVVGSFRQFVRLLLNGPNDEDDCEIEILKRSKQINHSCVFPDVDHLATAKKSDIYFKFFHLSSAAATKRLVNVLKFKFILARYGI